VTSSSADDRYPHLAKWVKAHGWIEIGHDDYSRSFIRVLDVGGMVWEGEETYPTLEEALDAAEQAVTAWIDQQFGQSARRSPPPDRAT